MLMRRLHVAYGCGDRQFNLGAPNDYERMELCAYDVIPAPIFQIWSFG